MPATSAVHHVKERGADLCREVCARDMEGTVAKLANGRYMPEETGQQWELAVF